MRTTEATMSSAPTVKYGPVIEGTKELKDLQKPPTNPEGEDGNQDGADEGKMPPVIRSVLELTHSFMSSQSQKLRMCPGYQGGLFYRGKPYCFACGYRDGTRGLDMDDKGNHLRLKDPCVVGSLSIPITAMLVGQLHDEGRPVSKNICSVFRIYKRIGPSTQGA